MLDVIKTMIEIGDGAETAWPAHHVADDIDCEFVKGIIISLAR
jgi:hypothetical protein